MALYDGAFLYAQPGVHSLVYFRANALDQTFRHRTVVLWSQFFVCCRRSSNIIAGTLVHAHKTISIRGRVHAPRSAQVGRRCGRCGVQREPIADRQTVWYTPPPSQCSVKSGRVCHHGSPRQKRRHASPPIPQHGTRTRAASGSTGPAHGRWACQRDRAAALARTSGRALFGFGALRAEQAPKLLDLVAELTDLSARVGRS